MRLRKANNSAETQEWIYVEIGVILKYYLSNSMKERMQKDSLVRKKRYGCKRIINIGKTEDI